MAQKTLRDPAYLLHLRDEPCLFTGIRGSGQESVVAAHIGTAGKGIKSPDNEAIPVANHIHMIMHSQGEASTMRKLMPDYILTLMAKAYARGLYAEWDHSIR
jgi:hypothetical protein